MILSFVRIGACAVLFALVIPASAQTPKPQQADSQRGSTSVAIVIDDSDAARKQFSQIREGVLAFVKAFDETDELCLVGVGGTPRILHELTYDPALITAAVQKIRPQGPPRIVPALETATQHLEAEAANDRSAIVMFVGSEE